MTISFTPDRKFLIFICFCVVPAVVSQLPGSFLFQTNDKKSSEFQSYLIRTQPHLGAFFGVQADERGKETKSGVVPDLEVIFPRTIGLAWIQ